MERIVENSRKIRLLFTGPHLVAGGLVQAGKDETVFPLTEETRWEVDFKRVQPVVGRKCGRNISTVVAELRMKVESAPTAVDRHSEVGPPRR